jgi:hypothetical protein
MLRVGLSPDGDITFGIKIVHLSLLKALALFFVVLSYYFLEQKINQGIAKRKPEENRLEFKAMRR